MRCGVWRVGGAELSKWDVVVLFDRRRAMKGGTEVVLLVAIS